VIFVEKYLVDRTVYLQSVGRLLPRRISQILRELGFAVWINPKQGNNVDMKVWYRNELILVVEILNWSLRSYLSEKRCNKIISNLSKYDCHRLIIYTVLDRKNWLRLRKNKMDTLKIGYQVLPKAFYDFFKIKRQVTKRKVDCKQVKKDIEFKILKYLKKKNLHVSTHNYTTR